MGFLATCKSNKNEGPLNLYSLEIIIRLYFKIEDKLDSIWSDVPYQGINQKIPQVCTTELSEGKGRIVAFPVLDGLHHSYERVA
jgi:hypothetical protein